MKFYYSFESTPLKFHNVFYKILSPIFIGVQALVLVATIGYLAEDSGFYNTGALMLNLIVSCLAIAFLTCITYGFAKKRPYAWYMVYAYLIIIVSSDIISITRLDNAAVAVGTIIGASFIPVLIGIYYYKRKPLFVFSNMSTSDAKSTTVNYCRKCGSLVIKDGAFCNKCGAKIYWNLEGECKND